MIEHGFWNNKGRNSYNQCNMSEAAEQKSVSLETAVPDVNKERVKDLMQTPGFRLYANAYKLTEVLYYSEERNRPEVKELYEKFNPLLKEMAKNILDFGWTESELNAASNVFEGHYTLES